MSQKIYRILTLIIGVFTFTATSANGQNPIAQWNTYGYGQGVIVSDCLNCDEDVGVQITCNGPNSPATVNVYYLRAYQGEYEEILITVGNRYYDRSAEPAYNDLVGYTPQFNLNKNDSLLKAMKSGSSIQFSYAGDSTTFSLKGSRRALDTFERECGWKRQSNNSSGGSGGWYATHEVIYNISDGFLAMRKGPGKGYTRIRKLDEGTRLQKLRQSGKWIKVKLRNGQTGWVHIHYTNLL